MAKENVAARRVSKNKNTSANAAKIVVKKRQTGTSERIEEQEDPVGGRHAAAAIAPFKGTGKRGRPAKVAQGVIGNGIRIVDGMALINLTGSRVNRILVIGSDAKTPVTHL
ncbi:hypothetical protein [Candidatus Pollutiaquabacter sp.]|uniref:hypothetical protein n=1 Tax=Candidatus Pollutiaquabacter sp. TaxID=3416354 RepID=UPI003CB0A3D4|nr:hypothetical protein [Bacteroidota bacterium]